MKFGQVLKENRSVFSLRETENTDLRFIFQPRYTLLFYHKHGINSTIISQTNIRLLLADIYAPPSTMSDFICFEKPLSE